MKETNLSLTQQKIYDALDVSGEDGSTTLLALMKLIYPNGNLHIFYKFSKHVIWLQINQINKKIEPSERIKHFNGTGGYRLIRTK